MAYLKSRRSIVNPHEGFLAQLGTFEAKLNSEREAAIADGQEKKVAASAQTRTHAKFRTIMHP